jgi:predicted Zn-dependent peptidase
MGYNAYTGSTTTAYTADGVSLPRVLRTVFQLGFHPLLLQKGLDADRNAVIEEAREEQYYPYRKEVETFQTDFAGSHYARLIQGNVEDVEQITADDINEFYRRNYQASNAFLVVCSSAPIARQRSIANRLAEEIDNSRTRTDPEAIRLDLPWLKPSEPVTTILNPNDELEAQSSVYIAYNLEIPTTFEEYVLLELAISQINIATFRRIREKLNLAYGASAELVAVENTNHGISEDYFALSITTSLHGTNVVSALNAIKNVEANAGRSSVTARAAILKRIRELKEAMQAPPTSVVESIAGSAQVYYTNAYSPEAEIEVVKSLSVDEVKRRAESLFADKRLVTISGPDSTQLRKASIHAQKL